jgi:hypothetical protein
LTVAGERRRQEQANKIATEKAALEKMYESDIQELTRDQKRQMEEVEHVQEDELKLASKRLRAQQEKDLRAFRENLRTEQKLLKDELKTTLPRAQRAEALQQRREQMDQEHARRVSVCTRACIPHAHAGGGVYR